MAECALHDEATLLCSCGYVRPDVVARLEEARELPGPAWTRAELEVAWREWDSAARAVYLDALEWAKPHEKHRMQAARFAAGQVLRHFGGKG